MDSHEPVFRLGPLTILSRRGARREADRRARRLQIDHSTLSRRLTALEAALGAKLFDRHVSGYSLTPQGEHLLQCAEVIESKVLAIQSDAAHASLRVSGAVRIGTPDGFGTAFLAPIIGRLSAAHPDLDIQLVATPRSFSLSRREKPTSPSACRGRRAAGTFWLIVHPDMRDLARIRITGDFIANEVRRATGRFRPESGIAGPALPELGWEGRAAAICARLQLRGWTGVPGDRQEV
jgi:Bacterial regulatory helix-turn-helix protein, lysR family